LDRPGAARRLTGEYVETRAYRTFDHRPLERRLIHNLRARRVDEVRPARHRLKKRPVDQVSCLVFERQMYAHDVRRLRHLERRRLHLDAEQLGTFLGERAAPADRAESKGARSRNHLLTDAAESDQSEGSTVKTSRLAVLFLVPAAFLQLLGSGGDPAVER